MKTTKQELDPDYTPEYDSDSAYEDNLYMGNPYYYEEVREARILLGLHVKRYYDSESELSE